MHDANRPDFMETRPVGRLLLEFSGPAIIATVVSATYNLIARVFVGQQIGMIGITALTVSYPVMLIMLAFAMMVATGATTLISLRLGEREYGKAEKILGQSLLAYLLLTVLFIVFGLTWLEDLLRLFGASDEVVPYAKAYMSVIIWGMIFQEISFGVNNFIRAEGRPNVAMISMLISVPVNILFLWLFLFKLDMGIWGAGLATVVAQFASSIWVVWLYLSGRTVLKWRLKNFVPDLVLIGRICVFGTVPLATQLCASLIQGLQCHVLGYYGDLYGQMMHLTGISGGDLAIGLFGTIFSIIMLMIMPIFGLGQGMQPIVGYNVGALRPERVRRTLTLSLLWSVLISLLFWSFGLLFPEVVLAPFLQKESASYEASLTLGVRAFRFLIFSAPVVGITITASGYFQAHGRPWLSLMLTLLRQLIFLIPLILFVPWYYLKWRPDSGMDGCWLAYPLADLLACLVAVVFLVREYTFKYHRMVRLAKIGRKRRAKADRGQDSSREQ
ncbi:MAG: MATE family efflux transporter [Planctomycetia bacterium]|nr:MATE family efflux transporter [Planctomycetia bacterium]